MKNSLIVQNLNYNVLNNISFSLNGNTFTALIGNSGSGKTSLLKCLAGLLEYSGNVSLNGSIITKTSKLNKNISIYLGTINLSNGTVFSNLMEPLNNLGISSSKSKNKIYEITKRLGVNLLLYKDIKNLSYAQKKVIAFIKSIIHEPSIVLIDNLFDSLDLNYKNKIVSYLSKLKNEKKAIIIFSTNDSENLILADNIIGLNKGKIVINGTSHELFEDSSLFIKNKLKLPFIVDLSHKLKAYELIDNLIYNIPEMVDELWK